MTPSARLQAAIEILTELERTNAPADRFVREWFRSRRYAGSKDRAAVGERVFQILRHRASLAWRMGSDASRSLAIASVLPGLSSPARSVGEVPSDSEAEGAAALDALFSGGNYGAAPLTTEERARIASPPNESPPLSVTGEFPAWLEPELARSLGDALLPEMQAMCGRASIDLRANTLKASREDVLRALQEAGFAAGPTPFAPAGIRIARDAKLSALSQMAAFEAGWFEFQDEAAQIASALCAAKPGERILDLAAGAGGKALALAAAMRNSGEIVACDIDDARLAQLGPRAARAGVSIIASHVSVGESPAGPFDAVLVDAPCSGTGTWRRQPELRWRLTREKLDALNRVQDKLLDRAAARARGRLIYATCSLLACENEDRIAAFVARHPEFCIRDAADVWRASSVAPLPCAARFFKASPLTAGTDGFFAAVMERTSSSSDREGGT
jgi:16S rRNA (cytosine967-C5)-methyltransferase